MTRGFADSGRFAPVFAVESDQNSAATYSLNFDESSYTANEVRDG